MLLLCLYKTATEASLTYQLNSPSGNLTFLSLSLNLLNVDRYLTNVITSQLGIVLHLIIMGWCTYKIPHFKNKNFPTIFVNLTSCIYNIYNNFPRFAFSLSLSSNIRNLHYSAIIYQFTGSFIFIFVTAKHYENMNVSEYD